MVLEASQSLCTHLARRLAGAVPLWSRPLALSSIPYGYVRREGSGPWRLGDQAAVIPSFTGDGMSIALHSSFLAASLYISGATATVFQRQLQRDLSRPIYLATLMSRMLIAKRGRAVIETAVPWFPGILPKAALSTRIGEGARKRVVKLYPV